jgi:hypothetical protein
VSFPHSPIARNRLHHLERVVHPFSCALDCVGGRLKSRFIDCNYDGILEEIEVLEQQKIEGKYKKYT